MSNFLSFSGVNLCIARSTCYSESKVGSWIRDYCWNNGMILRNNGDIIVIAPALTITKEQADEIIGKIDSAIAGAIRHFRL